jgi:hypothetical protein
MISVTWRRLVRSGVGVRLFSDDQLEGSVKKTV